MLYVTPGPGRWPHRVLDWTTSSRRRVTGTLRCSGSIALQRSSGGVSATLMNTAAPCLTHLKLCLGAMASKPLALDLALYGFERVGDHDFELFAVARTLLARHFANATVRVPYLAGHAVAALEPAPELAEVHQEIILCALELLQQGEHGRRAREHMFG